jgi:hypothetical protein
MVFDKVADGLRKYHRASSSAERIRLLQKLARVRDPRVAVALGEAAVSKDPDVSHWAIRLVWRHYDLRPSEDSGAGLIRPLVLQWWKENGADLRRRASQLPQ